MDLLAVSQRQGMPVLDANTGAQWVKSNLQHKPKGVVERILINELLDKGDVFTPAPVTGKPSFRPTRDEADGIAEVLAGVAAASFSAPSQLKNRVFEA
jgi:hypothetical protein